MDKKEITEKIGKVNLKIAATSKELNELALEYRRKKLELKQYKNDKSNLQLEIQRLAIEEWKEAHKNEEIKRIQRTTMEKYSYDPNNEYYSQRKDLSNDNDLYANYLVKNIVPYND